AAYWLGWRLPAVAATSAAASADTTWLLRMRHACSLPAARSAVAAAWLIPGVNLLAPAVLLSETWRLATPQESRRTRLALVTAWWLSWLTTLAVFTLVLPHDASDGLTGLGLLELACLTLSAAQARGGRAHRARPGDGLVAELADAAGGVHPRPPARPLRRPPRPGPLGARLPDPVGRPLRGHGPPHPRPPAPPRPPHPTPHPEGHPHHLPGPRDLTACHAAAGPQHHLPDRTTSPPEAPVQGRVRGLSRGGGAGAAGAGVPEEAGRGGD